VRKQALGLLLLVAGCLDYEVKVQTVVLKDGSAQRAVRIHERSDKHKTWRRYGQPQAPYVVAGDDAQGYDARASFKAGRHAGGLRYVHEPIEGEYKGAAESAGKPVSEGTFSAGADDLEIGTLYRYREQIDIGIDAVVFRAGLESVVRIAADFLVTALEVAEPDLDFQSVRDNARRRLVPEVTRVLLAIHSHLRLMEQNGTPIAWIRTVDDLTRNPEVAVMLAGLDRLGIRRRADAPKTNDLEKYFELDSWTLREGLWSRILAPLPGVNAKLRARLWDALTADDGKEGESEAEKRRDQIWKLASERAFPKEKSDAMEKAIRPVIAAGLGYPITNDLFDKHQIHVSVRMPGRVIYTNGVVNADGAVSWRVLPSGAMLSNRSLIALSFVPSKSMVGRIVDVSALLEFGRMLQEAKDGEREGLKQFLAEARTAGIEEARKKAGSNALVSALLEALATDG